MTSEPGHPSSTGAVRAALILLAAGSGTRFGHPTNKVFAALADRPVVAWSLDSAQQVPAISRTLLVISEVDRLVAERCVGLLRRTSGPGAEIVTGGATRHESEWLALQHLADGIAAGDLDVVVVHDAARPLAPPALFESVIAAAVRWGGAVPCRLQRAAISVNGPMVALGELVAVQTPQAFCAAPLLAAYTSAQRSGFVGTDTSSCVEHFGRLRVRCVPGTAQNLKITYVEDLQLASRLLQQGRDADQRSAT
ncbi:MAG: IspD/TarI family cytidylyltransferase [Nocardioidaceae bacterium]